MRTFGAISLLSLLTVGLQGCALPLATGPIVATERGVIETDEVEYRAIEIHHHTDGITYSLIAHDGIVVSPLSQEDEAAILIRDGRIERRIELLGDEGIPRARRVISAW